MKRCNLSLHLLARWYRDTLHLSRRGAIWAALLELLSCPGYLPPREVAEREWAEGDSGRHMNPGRTGRHNLYWQDQADEILPVKVCVASFA